MMQNSRDTAKVDKDKVGGNGKKSRHIESTLLLFLGPRRSSLVKEKATFNR